MHGGVGRVCRAEREQPTQPKTAQQPAPTTPPSTAPTEVPVTTDVQGKIPGDIAGRWLAVCQVKLQSGAARPVTRLFEIREGRDHLEVALGGDITTSNHLRSMAAINPGHTSPPLPPNLR